MCVMLGLALCAPSAGIAQVVPPPGGIPERPLQDTASAPPITPRRAFLTSLALPGLAQSKLLRPKSVALFGTVELGALLMLRKSLADLSRARKFRADSVIAAYEIDPATGIVARDPVTGQPRIRARAATAYDESLIAARRTHVEDWVALLAFNHLIAGADAFVAAHLWDVPLHVGVRLGPRSVGLSGSVAW
jgi:hypothetical protein